MTLLQCFVVDPIDRLFTPDLEAIERCSAPWVAVLSSRAMWAQRDWYPRILEELPRAGAYGLLVPCVNEPGPDWQAAGPASDDIFAHRALAKAFKGSLVDVTDEPGAVGVAAVVRRRDADDVLRDGLAAAHARAVARGARVGLMRSVYVVQHACF